MASVVGYLERWGHLDNVAQTIRNGNRGGFLTSFAVTWLRADVHNKAILEHAFKKLIEKYRLRGSR